MGTRDPRVDRYIEQSAEFARPILTHFRTLVHETVPHVEEAMKWTFPHFLYKGMLCSMASFKQHCAIGFWKASLVLGPDATREAMGHLGRITSLADLPPDRVLAGYLSKAAALNDYGVKVERKPPARKRLVVPPALSAALKRNRKAASVFEGFTYSHRKEYIDWIAEAKTDATRERRVQTTIAWLAEGKPRNWKYTKA